MNFATRNVQTLLILLLSVLVWPSHAPGQTGSESVWDPDLHNGSYRNPVLFADYSDPDVVRVGADFYLVSSSFDAVPGLPILHSRDLVHWRIVGHALHEQPPIDLYRSTQRGRGAWAPAIRYHNGEFYLFYPDPDFGIYMIKSRHAAGPWSAPRLIKAAKGWIDPCPLWDDDGKAYLVNALAGSRAGAKSVIVLSRMKPDGTALLDGGAIVIDGHPIDDTLEGPKIYKRAGFYYIFAPAGGVTAGYQLVFRSHSIDGPYDRRVVLHQGSTSINGPHQGAWVTTGLGEDWFLHFQDLGPYGRVVDLEPMHWGADGWPLIGTHHDANGNGEPVLVYRKPRVQNPGPQEYPQASDEFDHREFGPQWQWPANPGPTWALPSPATGSLRMFAVPDTESARDLRKNPRLLLQKFTGPVFSATARLRFSPRHEGERAGIVVLGRTYSTLFVENTEGHISLVQETAPTEASASQRGQQRRLELASGQPVWFRMNIAPHGIVNFSYSLNGVSFQPFGESFPATPGIWIGAKLGIYALGATSSETASSTGESGYADWDWLRISSTERSDGQASTP